jgi:hypothetical protein
LPLPRRLLPSFFAVKVLSTSIGAGFPPNRPKVTFRDLSTSIDSSNHRGQGGVSTLGLEAANPSCTVAFVLQIITPMLLLMHIGNLAQPAWAFMSTVVVGFTPGWPP